ncbi:hypothetical protein NSK_006817 [Nannochloropsis salina CCMP1776]|uniref:Nucleotide-diphospho-sugar transferase domain-containing protein n=1 Tax=Nannochloropsis salina CCMP1776 TaxID=1027361 RepID=A0A4D9CRY1_9STRA|nr:hypothetical protein NSK_006817 [Nannochloropsis salina CCMP1776]|eukprot:TFJ81566.1 hypothetical protein NSK_006817 [Nannochloropsis salina CCMP1776]
MNKRYADAHGYDFVYSRPLVTATFREMMWAALEKEGEASDCKVAAPLWHFNRSSLRSAPWAKLPAAWHFALEYDWIVSIDSDAVFRNMSWKLPQSLAALRPDQDFLFLSDMPYSYMMPCSGFFVVRGGDRGRKRLETWWNTTSQTDRRHAYEQTALWQRITPQTRAGTQYDADFANAGVRIDAAQFYRSGGYWPVSKPHSWILHVGSPEPVGRAPIFDGILEERNISLQARALPLLKEIPTTLINGNAVALDMEKFNSAKFSNWLEGTLDSSFLPSPPLELLPVAVNLVAEESRATCPALFSVETFAISVADALLLELRRRLCGELCADEGPITFVTTSIVLARICRHVPLAGVGSSHAFFSPV